MPTEAEESIDAFQQYYRRPPEISKKESFRQFLWNPKDRSFFGRTGPSWSKWFYISKRLLQNARK